jgi:hypothetical protein
MIVSQRRVTDQERSESIMQLNHNYNLDRQVTLRSYFLKNVRESQRVNGCTKRCCRNSNKDVQVGASHVVTAAYGVMLMLVV